MFLIFFLDLAKSMHPSEKKTSKRKLNNAISNVFSIARQDNKKQTNKQ